MATSLEGSVHKSQVFECQRQIGSSSPPGDQKWRKIPPHAVHPGRSTEHKPHGWQWKRHSLDSLPETELGSEGSSRSGRDPSPTLLPFEQSGELVSSGGKRLGIEDSDSDEDDLIVNDSDWDSDSDGKVTAEILKKSKWFKGFFESLELQTVELINEAKCQLHCPACHGAARSTEWYRGAQTVLNHAKTVSSKRVKLHRKFAHDLEDELKRRGARLVLRTEEEPFRQRISSPESNDAAINDNIIWPPMIMVQNTRLEIDDRGKWIGMSNEELLELFKGYTVWNAKNAYGPGGHRGFALLRFDSSPVGYLEAERLHRHFIIEGRGRAEWESRRGRIHSMGKRILYGYYVSKEDMEFFNRHSKGKQKQKYEIKSYQLMVAEPLKKMDEDNEELLKLQRKDMEGQDTNKSLQETCRIIERNLYLTEMEIKNIRKRDMEHHKNIKEQMDYLDESNGKIIKELTEELEKKKMELEKMQDLSNKKCLDRYVQLEAELDTLMGCTSLTEKEYQENLDGIEKEMTMQENEATMSFKCLEEYEREKRSLWEEHCKKLKEVKERNLEANLALEKMMEKERLELLEKYAEKTMQAFL